MSLINDMLRDLEARRAGELARPDLQREIRPLPKHGMPYRLLFSLAGLVAATAIGIGAWLWGGRTGEKGEVPRASESPMASSGVAAVPATPPIPPEYSPGAVAEALRLALELSNPPGEGPAGDDRAGSRPDAKPQGGLPSPKSVLPIAAPAEPAAVKPPAGQGLPPSQGNIEKTEILTPRERADAEYRRAQSLLASGGAAEAAVDILQGALRLDGGNTPARRLLLKILLESRRGDEAMAVLQEGVEQQPGQVGWAMSLARLQVERGDLVAAEHILARYAAYGAGNAEYVGFHGHLLNRLGRFREGAEQYLAATRLAPADGRWWFGLGQSLEGAGRSEEARGAFRRALETGNLNADLAALAEQKIR